MKRLHFQMTLVVIMSMVLASSPASYGQNAPHPSAKAAQDKLPTESLKKIGDTWTNSIGMKFTYIPSGEFDMGSPNTEAGRSGDETLHRVKTTKPFMMAVTTVTQAQWKAVMGTTVAQQRDKASALALLVGEADALPMYFVSWDEAVEFCKKLSQAEGKHYRLATESEWEYACRAGAQDRFGGSGNLDEMGWFGDNSGDQHFDSNDFWKKDAAHYDKRVVTEYHCRPHPVGEKKPNAWGLYDMHGNVWEWCNDFFGDYPPGPVSDPAGPVQGTARVLRGGAWNVRPYACRCAFRHKHAPDSRNYYIGFRVCLDYQPTAAAPPHEIQK